MDTPRPSPFPLPRAFHFFNGLLDRLNATALRELAELSQYWTELTAKHPIIDAPGHTSLETLPKNERLDVVGVVIEIMWFGKSHALIPDPPSLAGVEIVVRDIYALRSVWEHLDDRDPVEFPRAVESVWKLFETWIGRAPDIGEVKNDRQARMALNRLDDELKRRPDVRAALAVAVSIACKELGEAIDSYRDLTHPTPSDYARVVSLYLRLAHLTMAVGLPQPPNLREAYLPAYAGHRPDIEDWFASVTAEENHDKWESGVRAIMAATSGDRTDPEGSRAAASLSDQATSPRGTVPRLRTRHIVGMPIRGESKGDDNLPHSQVAANGSASAAQTKEERVSLYLKNSSNPTMGEALQKTCMSELQIRRTTAWKAYEERLLEEFLQRNPMAVGSDVQAALGFSESKTVLMAAWMTHKRRKDAAKPPRMVKERPLTDAMACLREDETASDPSANLEKRDLLFRAVVESSDSTTKAKVLKLSKGDQEALLDYVVQNMDHEGLTAANKDKNIELMLEVTKQWLDEYEQERQHKTG